MPLVDGFDDTSILSIGHLGIVAGVNGGIKVLNSGGTIVLTSSA